MCTFLGFLVKQWLLYIVWILYEYGERKSMSCQKPWLDNWFKDWLLCKGAIQSSQNMLFEHNTWPSKMLKSDKDLGKINYRHIHQLGYKEVV